MNEWGHYDLEVLSLGAGVQSTTVALMAANGDLGFMPHCAVFADTQWEPKEVYAQFARLETLLPFPIYRVTSGNLRQDVLDTIHTKKRSLISLPFYVRDFRGEPGRMRRECTRNYKIAPIQHKIRQLLGLAKGQRSQKRVRQWIGISTDEAHRQRDGRVSWIDNWYPLIERGMSRDDCLRWLREHDHPRPRKSACIGCPFHTNHVWARMKRDYPKEWADAVEFDANLRANGNRIPGTTGECYLHRRMLPLPEAIAREDDPNQGEFTFMDEECEGMCGL